MDCTLHYLLEFAEQRKEKVNTEREAACESVFVAVFKSELVRAFPFYK